jgi:hypothetical protein
MGFFRWTRKQNKPKQNNTLLPPPPPPTPHQLALIERLKEEIRNLIAQRDKRRVNWIRKLSTSNQNTYSPYENVAIDYLIQVLEELQKDQNPFFFNEAYRTFLDTKNQFVKSNTNVFQKRSKSLPLINSIFRRMRLYTQKLNNNNTPNNSASLPRRRTSTFSTFSDTESNTEPTLFTIQQLRNNTRYRPTRRLKGRIVKPNQGTPPLEEV